MNPYAAPSTLSKILDKLPRPRRLGSRASLIGLTALLVIATAATGVFQHVLVKPAETQNALTRGVSGDLVADIQVGKRDFTEIVPKEVVASKVNGPGGAIVDQSVSPGRLYVWDSGNSRILGINLETCYEVATGPCSADIVIGQPSANDYGACNRDSSMQNYPHRATASASTLCGMPDYTHTTLEDKSFANMYVDSQGNLWVPDTFNNRVLKYNSPFTTDTVADEVWGQADFGGVYCNRTAPIENGSLNTSGGMPSPTDTSLCFNSTYARNLGVTLDADGNLWVADGGNNRVLRFSRDATTDSISKTASLILGQPSYTQGPASAGANMNQLSSPTALAFDQSGKLYVADSGNDRVLVYAPPFSNHMNASGTIGSGHTGMTGLQQDPWNRGIWTYENVQWDAQPRLWSYAGELVQDLPKLGNNGGGSLGFDATKQVIATTYVYGQNAYRLTQGANGQYTTTKELFSPPYGYNLSSDRRLDHPAWNGVAVIGDQLMATDGRLLVWNNVAGLTNGQAPNASVGAPNAIDKPNPEFSGIKADKQNRLWTAHGNSVRAYQAPLDSTSTPVKILTSPLPALGGGQVSFSGVVALVPTANSSHVWLSEPGSNRVFRVKNPLTSPVVDVILGQTTLAGNQCNRGLVQQPNQSPGRPASEDASLNMLCEPGMITIDNLGNLYVSDHFIEAAGNWRLLMFKADQFPASPSSVIYAPDASKEFPRGRDGSQGHAHFEVAFDSNNRMVTGNNPYLGERFLEYYNDPTKINSTNPRDPNYANRDGQFKDYYGWAVSMTFDDRDNLYAYDANRGQVRVYYQPFGPASTPTPVQSSFSNLSTNLTVSQAAFNFSYSGQADLYQVDVSTEADMSWDVYGNFASGAQSPVVNTDAAENWDKYSCGRTLYWRVSDQERTVVSPIQTMVVPCPTPTPTPLPAFTELSANFTTNQAQFNFNYSGQTTHYVVDLSSMPDMSWDVYGGFAGGSASPIVVNDPTKWDKYSCGRTLYWRVWNEERTIASPIQSKIVPCPTPTPTPIPTPTPPPAPLSYMMEVENFTSNKSNIRKVSDSSASNGLTMKFAANGQATSNLTTVSRTTRVNVNVRPEACFGAPRIRVTIDGDSRYYSTISGNKYTNIALNLTLNPGQHSFKVEFDNDQSVSLLGMSICDRNLYVDRIELK